MATEGWKEQRPNLSQLFKDYNELYFDGKLGDCTVEWSTDRMTRCAGNCRQLEANTCTIRISEPLHKLRPVDDLKNTLLHEMIHALMFLERTEDRDGHGPEFEKWKNLINGAIFADCHRPPEGYNVTMYHDFEEESEFYKRHWWRCEKCGNEIKRAMNRKPQDADCAKANIKNGVCHDQYCTWHQHQKTCGGEYIKVREPLKKPQKRLLSSIGSPLKKRRKNKQPRYALKDSSKDKLEEPEQASDRTRKSPREEKGVNDIA